MILCFGGVDAFSQTAIQNVTVNANPVLQYSKFEITFALSTLYNNPFDPDEVDCRGVFESPSGEEMVVIAFWSGAEYPTAPTTDWKIRFAGHEPGSWSYRIVVDDQHGSAQSPPATFTVLASDNRGFIGLDPYHPNTLRFSEGQPYHPFGHNLAWQDSFGLNQYAQWLQEFQQHGLNWSRVWMNPYTVGLEWSGTNYFGIGRYSQRHSRHFDGLLDLAEQHGVYFQMCFYSFNELSTGSFSNWEHNPYRTIHGGWIDTPAEWWTNRNCIESNKKLLRYIVARWGYSTKVMCWQLYNEFNMISRTDFINPGNWHSEMAAYINTVDPFNHLITTSFTNQLSGGVWNADFWRRPELTMIQEHRYSADVPAGIVRLADSGTMLGKPSLVGEVGTDPSAWHDTNGNYLRQFAWGTSMRLSGSMYWWWQGIHQANTLGNYLAAIAYKAGEDWGARGVHLSDFVTEGVPSGFRTYGVQSQHRAYVWLRAPDSNKDITGGTLRIGGLLDGTYNLEWWQTRGEGGRLSSSNVTSSANNLSINLPPFHADIAIKVLPLTPEPTVTPIGTPVFGTATPTPTYVPGSLISQNKPAFASSIFGPGYEASKANDGITNSQNSRWVSSDFPQPHWWYVDLGEPYQLSKLDLYSEQSSGQSQEFNVSGWRIRASLNGGGSMLTWNEVGQYDNSCGPPFPDYDPQTTHLSGVYRYVGIEITKNDGMCGTHARVLEVQVFGNTPAPTATVTPSHGVPTATASSTATPHDEFTCMGDADRNGFVNSEDFRVVRDHFGQTTTGRGDANGDGFVNADDFRAVRDYFGKACP